MLHPAIRTKYIIPTKLILLVATKKSAVASTTAMAILICFHLQKRMMLKITNARTPTAAIGRPGFYSPSYVTCSILLTLYVEEALHSTTLFYIAETVVVAATATSSALPLAMARPTRIKATIQSSIIAMTV